MKQSQKKRTGRRTVLEVSLMKQLHHLLIASLLIAAVSGGALALIGLGHAILWEDSLIYVFAEVFWLALIAQVFMIFPVSSKRRMLQEAEGAPKKKFPGILFFPRNPYARIVDIVLVIALIGTVCLFVSQSTSKLLSYFFIALLIVSVQLHGVLNGKSYRFYFEKKREGV